MKTPLLADLLRQLRWLGGLAALVIIGGTILKIISLPADQSEGLVLQMQLVIAGMQLVIGGLVAWATVRYAGITSRSLELTRAQQEEHAAERRLSAITDVVAASNHAIINAQAIVLVQRRALSLRHRFGRGFDERQLGIQSFHRMNDATTQTQTACWRVAVLAPDLKLIADQIPAETVDLLQAAYSGGEQEVVVALVQKIRTAHDRLGPT